MSLKTPDNENNTISASGASDHLANERTFLAWIRTSIGIMAFGFVVVKFALFIKQISLVLGKQSLPPPAQHGYSSAIGIFLVVSGAFVTLLSYLRYEHVKTQLNKGNYTSSSTLIIAVMATVLLVGLLLSVYLIQSV